MPLHIVAGLGSDELVIYFLDAGVDVNCKDSFGKYVFNFVVLIRR